MRYSFTSHNIHNTRLTAPRRRPGAYKHEREELQMTQHQWDLDEVEMRLIGPQNAARVANAALGAPRPTKARGPGVRVKKVRKARPGGK